MARIRNIKPEFFSHEELQDMEKEHPELYPMLVFSGLWTQCEWSGVFLWSIRKLRLSILPFLDFELEDSLKLLLDSGYIRKFSNNGKDYGYVCNFTKYQAISGNEKTQELKYPVPDAELDRDYTGTRQGLDKDCTGTIPELDRDYTESPDSDIDIDIRLRHRNLPPQKPIALLDREPKNDLERVNKQWLLNYISLHGNPPISPRWDLTSSLVSKAIKQAGVEKVLQALDTAMKDKFCLESGYMLKIIMSGNVISRLVNKPPGSGPPGKLAGKKSLGGLEI